MNRSALAALVAVAVALACAGAAVAWRVAHHAVRSAEAEVLRAETALAARWLREPGGEARVEARWPGRWRFDRVADPQLDEPEVAWAGPGRRGRAAVYDAEGWDVVGQVAVRDDPAVRAAVPRAALWLAPIALALLVVAAGGTVWRVARRGLAAGLAGPAVTWCACAVAILVVPGAIVERWAVHQLRAATDRRLALAQDALRHADVEALARQPSGIPDLTGLRFVPLASLRGEPPALAGSGLPVEAAHALAKAPPPRSGRVEVDRVVYAVADVGPVRLLLLPFDATHRPTDAMVASAAVGVVTAIPLLALAALASSRRRLRREIVAWSFLLPGLTHLAVFTVGPLLFAAWLSLHRWSLVDPARPFVGLENYVALASHAPFWRAMANTALFTLHVPASMAIALGLALLVRRPGAASVVARAAFFLPSITSVVAVAMVWQWMLHDEYGLVNAALARVGLPRVPWLSSPAVALVSVMIVATWTTVGFQTVLFQAGLTAIPRHLYDAARIDGASRWQQFVHVTLPGLRPTLFFVFVTSVIGSFQVFGTVYVMTEGGPLHATDVAVFHIYEEAWELQRVGSAAAMSWTLFAVIFGVTWLQFRTIERRAAEGDA